VCGLLGVVFPTEEVAEQASDTVAAALRCQRHRGPDASGVWTGDEAVFGVNRLSVIDVGQSRQPLHWSPANVSERYTILFDGAIYNHLELREELISKHGAAMRTHGDGEVVVALYHYLGPAAVTRLRGMFAFVIWDWRRRELFGARDPFGIKPLYYSAGPGGVAFSSEKKSLLELAPSLHVRNELDQKALQHYLVLQYVPEPESLHSRIRRIEAGSSFTVRPGGQIVSERYFFHSFRPTPVRGQDDEERLYDQIAEVMRDSVARHMRADVTVGAFLSGGLDSTAIAALAREHNPDLITFTTGFEREGYSEVELAAESAAAIGVRHVVRTVSAEEMMESLPLIVWYLDDPVADPALVPLWFIAREARQHVKVVLSGEGADELFGGYSIYREPSSLAPFERVPGALRRAMGSLSTKMPDGKRGKDLLRRGALDLEHRYYGNARIFRDDQLKQVLRKFDENVGHLDVTAAAYEESVNWDPVTRMQHVDLFTWLRGDILVKADKVTMANSLELRVPFLDTEVFKIAARLPAEQKVTKDTTKYALRQALRRIVPEHVLERRTLGFPVPIRLWLKDEMYDWARQIVLKSQTDEEIDKNAVLRLLEEHRAGTLDHSRRIWALLVYMLWHGIFVEDRIRPRIPEPNYPVTL
jgi:asparagine synthase (glutamine-hydrolysing)